MSLRVAALVALAPLLSAGGESPGERGAPPIEEGRPLKSAQVIRLKDVTAKFGVASDGCLWAETFRDGVLRFDGKQWAPVQALRVRGAASIDFFLPGADGTMLVKADATYHLFTAKRTCSNTSLRKLIESAKPDFVAAFQRGGNTHNKYGNEIAVAADKAGNVWMLDIGTKMVPIDKAGHLVQIPDDGKVCVLVGNQWVECAEALGKAGSRTQRMEYLAPVGDGSKIFMTDFLMVHDRGRSFFGHLDGDGKAVFEEAPATCRMELMPPSVYDPAGGFWLPTDISRALPTCDEIVNQVAYRLTEKGIDATLKDSGWPRLCDHDGNVWLGHVRGGRWGQLNVWREGKIAATLIAPEVRSETKLFAERSGSVLAWTKFRLRRLATPDPKDPARFERGPVYECKDLPASYEVGYGCGHMYCQVTKMSDRKNQYGVEIYEHYLHVIAVPEPEGKPKEAPAADPKAPAPQPPKPAPEPAPPAPGGPRPGADEDF